MNIYKKKIVKEKELIFNEVCSQEKGTYPNSKLENNWDIISNINVRQFYGINSKHLKNEKIIKNNRQNRSKSLIITNKDTLDKYIPKEIKTVLIKLNKPLEKFNNNNIDSSKNKAYYTNDFDSIKNINKAMNENKTIEYQPYINNRQNIINFDNHYENINNYNINLLSLYAPRQSNHLHKLTRNKSMILKNEMKHDNISIYSSFNTIYKKSYCLDKHKNYGGNFRNKERSKTNSYIKLTKNNNNENKIKKTLIKNVSSPNIFNIMNSQNSLGYNNFNNKNDNIGKVNNIQIKNHVINDMIEKKVNKDNKSFLKVELCKNKDEIKNKLKIKNIPPLDFKDNIRNSTNNINIDSKNNIYEGFMNRNKQNKSNNTNLISLNKCKNTNIMTFEESMNDMYSMRNKKNNKSNLINIISISEQETKREEQNNNHKIDKRDKNVNKWDNNKSKTKKDNNNKISIKKNKIKRKGKLFRENNAKKIEIENNPYKINLNNMNKIKSIPLKFKNLNDLYLNSQNYCNKNINSSRNNGYNILNNNKINTNVIIINDKDFNLWNDLTRIYNINGK